MSSSLYFYIVLALPTVHRAPGVPELQNIYFLMYTCEQFVTGQSLLITRSFELALQKNLVATLPRVRTCSKRRRTIAVAKCPVPPSDLKAGECQLNSHEAVRKMLAWSFARSVTDRANRGRFYIPGEEYISISGVTLHCQEQQRILGINTRRWRRPPYHASDNCWAPWATSSVTRHCPSG